MYKYDNKNKKNILFYVNNQHKILSNFLVNIGVPVGSHMKQLLGIFKTSRVPRFLNFQVLIF